MIGFRRSALGRSAFNFTAEAPTSVWCSTKSKRHSIIHDVGPDPADECGRLKELRDTLNTVDERMHSPVGGTGVTPFQALSRLVAAADAGVAQ